jgi:hypothetical protein
MYMSLLYVMSVVTNRDVVSPISVRVAPCVCSVTRTHRGAGVLSSTSSSKLDHFTSFIMVGKSYSSSTHSLFTVFVCDWMESEE